MLSHEEELHSNETCRRIMAAAAEEFARNGFASARVRHIVEAAQVNLAAINYYFGGKEGLYRATLKHLAGDHPKASPVPVTASPCPKVRLERRIHAILERYVGSDTPSVLGRILAHEAMNSTAYVEPLIQEMLRPDIEHLRTCVQDLAGPQMESNDVTHAAMGILAHCFFFLMARPVASQVRPELAMNSTTSEVARHVMRFSLGGIRGYASNDEMPISAERVAAAVGA